MIQLIDVVSSVCDGVGWERTPAQASGQLADRTQGRPAHRDLGPMAGQDLDQVAGRDRDQAAGQVLDQAGENCSFLKC